MFRARDEKDLTLYGDVLIGRPSAERFSILLDGSSFGPEQRIEIGFEDDPFQGDERTVGDYLVDSGVDAGQMEPLLYSVGLGGLRPARCRELGVEQKRILRIVAALSSVDKVIILADPFAGLSEKWCEALGERIAEWAWRERRLVIVVRLSTRPDCWIDNEYIARIQLEKPRERTIGFGGGDVQTAELVGALRQELQKHDAKNAPPSAAPRQGQRVRRPTNGVSLTAVPKPKSVVPQAMRQAVLAALGVCSALLFIVFQNSGSTPPPVPILPVAPVPAVQESTPPPAVPAKTSAPVKPPEQVLVVKPLLDDYPQPVRDAVLKAFREPQAVLKTIVAKAPSFDQPANPKQREASAPPPEAPPIYAPDTVITQPPADEAELEEQRALLRRQFLEAVARARERQIQEGVYPLPQ